MTNYQASILIVDDHKIVVEGCVSLLRQSGYKSIAVATDCETALQHVVEHKPDLAVVDISMPGIGGLGLIHRIQKMNLNTRIIVFSMHDDPTIVYRTMNAGVKGYISKTSPPDKIIDAVNDVMSGKIYLSEEIAQSLAMDRLNPAESALDSLTPKEYEIFDMIVNGKSVTEIAEVLHLSPKSVSNSLTKIKTKLDANTTVELVHIGYKHNIAGANRNISS